MWNLALWIDHPDDGDYGERSVAPPASSLQDPRQRFSFSSIRRWAVMDDAVLIDLGDWKNPPLLILECASPHDLVEYLQVYLSWNCDAIKEGAVPENEGIERKSGWLEKRGRLNKCFGGRRGGGSLLAGS